MIPAKPRSISLSSVSISRIKVKGFVCGIQNKLYPPAKVTDLEAHLKSIKLYFQVDVLCADRNV